MTTNPNAITVLCYGDSNTWGQKPDKAGRYPVNVRWTGRLQEQLGDDFYVIEEGLSSRTTDLEYAKKPGRNGKTYLIPCLASQNPIDIAILMLGTNDLKIEFKRSPEDIADAVKGLVADIKQNAFTQAKVAPKVLLVSPILVNDKARNFDEFYRGVYDAESAAKSHRHAEALNVVANTTGSAFFDASTVSAAGDDGIHFSEAAHIALAEALRSQVHDLIS